MGKMRSHGYRQIITDSGMPLDVLVMVGLNTVLCYVGDLFGPRRYEVIDRPLSIPEVVKEAKRFSAQCKFRLTYGETD